MASVKKFAQGAVVNQLRHNCRTIENPSNPDIDPERSCNNYSLLPPREVSDYDFFLQRKNELYCYNRPDVKVLASWVVTAPQDLPVDQERAFFETTTKFLMARYGENNTIQAIVHGDEAGQPHLHFCFIPAAADLKHGGEKICANDILNRAELRSFHPALQKYLNEAGFSCHVQTGITQEIGGNLTVDQLKRAERYLHEHNVERERGSYW